MRVSIYIACLILALSSGAFSQVNFNTLPVKTWAQISTSGQYPAYGVETHLAFDTSGNAYMLGSCSYGGFAGGTHNNDIFRFNIKSGVTTRMYTCGTNPWPGGCQGGQAFDPTRNVIWFGPGNNTYCSNNIQWFPGQAYYGGLYKMTLPGGALEKVQDQALGGGYYVFDPVNDLVIGVAHNNYFGCRLSIYDIANKTTSYNTAPFNSQTNTWRIPVAFDTRRGLLAITRWGSDAGTAFNDFWFFNPGTKAWHKKTPSSAPPMVNVPLVYEPVSDKYMLIGTHEGSGDEHPQVWEYDYGGNAWTQHPRGSRSYNASNPLSSTWPPLRVYPGSFGFDVKNGVIANWGGLNTNGSGWDGGSKQPLWTYKLSAGGGTREEGRGYGAEGMGQIAASPNPFRESVHLTFPAFFQGGALVRIYDPAGRLAADVSGHLKPGGVAWHAAGHTPGLYIAAVEKGGLSLRKKILMVR